MQSFSNRDFTTIKNKNKENEKREEKKKTSNDNSLSVFVPEFNHFIKTNSQKKS